MESRTLSVIVLLALPVYGVLLFLLIIDASANHSIEGRRANIHRSRGTGPQPPRPPVTPTPHKRYKRNLAVSHDYMSAFESPKSEKENQPFGIENQKISKSKDSVHNGLNYHGSLDFTNNKIGKPHENIENTKPKIISVSADEGDIENDDYYADEEEDGDYNWSRDYYKYRNYARHYMYADIFAPEFIIENGERCSNDTKIFVFVNSRVESAKTRNIIRNSYMKSFVKHKVPYAFLISRPSNQTQMLQIKKENEIFGDLVVVGSSEGYTNLTLKTGHLIRWAGRHCPSTAYIAKIDDDVYVNVPNFLEVLGKPRNKTILGQVCSTCLPYTGDGIPITAALTMTHDVLTRQNMPLRKYPPFATGPAYVITADVIPFFEEASLLMQYLSFEDVFWTGLIVERINLESGKTLALPKDGGSVRFKYFTLKAQDPPRVTIHREDIQGWRMDHRVSKDLQEGLRKSHDAVILHGIDWKRDKDFVSAMDRITRRG